ncbi:MAG: AMP-binding protein [Acidobacteria bacterium]|nr:AMP-binding protein [Acidobacteriota bacterium]MXZ70824.1 AMP-binding protein [Acidobacteriota bacterium]MYJ04537.1 AMP-binding protein [Acidobacteriota bacterium]
MDAGASVEERVLDVIAELAGELRGGADGGAIDVKRGDSLETDLGISSLERVELLIRLERSFGVRLGDDAMMEAETPADLAAAIAAAAATPAAARTTPSEVSASRTEAAGAAAVEATVATPSTDGPPVHARSIVEALAWHVERTPDRVHIHLREDDGSETPLTYAWLWDEARAVAGGLAARGLGRGDRVALMLRTERAFFPIFIGTLMAGCVPAPLYPPFRADRIEEYASRQVAILRNAGARLLVAFPEVQRVAGLLKQRAPSLEAIVGTDALGGEARRPATATGDDAALIQYTSGSTGEPKGVLLTNANLLANIRAIIERLDFRAHDVGVSWLPLYHDMGLIGAWLGTLYTGAPLALMSPLAFLSRPVRWLQALSTHRGTVSPAPNFAYDLCVSRISDDELEGLDLRSVRTLLNGSEAVSPDTLRRFNERFAPYGLDPTAMQPVYGLAECSVGLATPTMGTPFRIDRIDRERYESSAEAAPAAADDAHALEFVSCGRALDGHDMAVVDDANVPVPERRRGRIRFRGPSATSGYFRNPEATGALIGSDGWLETGDLGYLADGDLFITGRSKDLIIKAGRNLAPPEAEELASAVDGIRAGCVAAFGVRDETRGTEQFVIIAETRVTEAKARTGLRQAVNRAITGAMGVAPDRIVLAPPGSVLKTSSGKIRRGATRDAWVSGAIDRGQANMAAQWIRLGAAAAGAMAARQTARAARLLFSVYAYTVVFGTAIPASVLLRFWPQGGQSDALVGRWTRLVMALGRCPIEVVMPERGSIEPPVVFVANHASFLDPPVMMATLPFGARFAAKAKLARYPLVGLAIRKGSHIRLHKTDQAQRIEEASSMGAPLDAGEALFIFPEGTFDRAPRLLPFRLGAFRAAVDAGCPIVPVAIRGTRHIWPADTLLLRPGPITVTFGEPIHPKGTDWSEIVRLRDEARAFISTHCGEP